MPSTETLSSLRARVETHLQDAAGAKWTPAGIDEAIEHALQRYNRAFPDEAIGTIELSSAGREIDISSLTGWLDVRRVWWDYDASDPGYPPNWRDFDLWPGQLLYISDAAEPQSGDVVRVWYTRPHTLSGLAGATATTFPYDHEEILITGAAGIAASSRAIGRSEKMNVDGQVVSRIEAWAQERLSEFEASLARLAASSAARASGVAPGPRLDRWDRTSNSWQ